MIKRVNAIESAMRTDTLWLFGLKQTHGNSLLNFSDPRFDVNHAENPNIGLE